MALEKEERDASTDTCSSSQAAPAPPTDDETPTPPASLPPPHDAVSGDVDVEWGERDAGLCHRRVTLSRNVCTEATPRDADDAAAVDVDAEASPPRNRCTSSGDRASPPRVDVYTESTESSLR